MQISCSNHFNYADKTDTKCVSIEDQIRKLEELKRKIEQDLQKKSTNPDPLAAIGDNNANSIVNQRILEKIETKLKSLETRKESISNSENDSAIKNKKINSPLYEGNHIDILA